MKMVGWLRRRESHRDGPKPWPHLLLVHLVEYYPKLFAATLASPLEIVTTVDVALAPTDQEVTFGKDFFLTPLVSHGQPTRQEKKGIQIAGQITKYKAMSSLASRESVSCRRGDD